ncbi:hypothetical protein [Chryseobacterium sp. 2R14A]|uniref:hypothetical protein n=1 Tax=Chryseobacterium sp. 2R14A TaxID=3380353 RepID=UPI003CF55298
MRALKFFLLIIFLNVRAQSEDFYFIGEKIKEEYCPESITVIPAQKLDCAPNDEDEKCRPMIKRPKCNGAGKFYSKFRVVKVLKGKFDDDTVEFYSIYCSEFGYNEPLNTKYMVIGLSKDKKVGWYQHYIEKIHEKGNNWILPYKKNYPFINYKTQDFLTKLKPSERIRINTKEVYRETSTFSEYPEPYYKQKKDIATAQYGFVFQK